jgi:hypothetical protein
MRPVLFFAVILFVALALLWTCRTAYNDGRNPRRPWEYYSTPPAPGWEKNRAMFHIDEEPDTRPTGTPTTGPSPRPPLPSGTP